MTEEDGGALPEGKPQVAVIGTRRMGAAMVARLRSAGADVVDVQPDRGRGLAERVGISAQLGRLPHTLSGGQQQRTAIARALVTSPEVIFADEPTAALDLVMAQHVLGLLRQAVDELGQTVVVVTHDPAVAGHADRVLLLAEGRLVDELTAPDPARISRLLHDLAGRR